MDLVRRLKLLVCVAEVGSFARAAGVLQIDPSAVSHGIGGLEKELGVRLLHRTTRQLSLTAEGHDVVQRARVVLSELECISDVAPRADRPLTGMVRIGMSVGFSHHVLMPRIGEFLRSYPGIRVESLLLASAADLNAGGLDIVLQSGEPQDSAGLIARHLLTLQLGVYASPDYLERAGVPETPDDLQQHVCLVHKPHFIHRPWNDWDFVRGEEQVRIKVPTQLVTDDRAGLVAAAKSGAGIVRIGLLSPALVAKGRLVRLLTDWKCPGGPEIYLLYRKSGRDNPRTRAMLDFVTRVFDDFDPEEASVVHKLEQG